jgi:hypothetical protein
VTRGGTPPREPMGMHATSARQGRTHVSDKLVHLYPVHYLPALPDEGGLRDAKDLQFTTLQNILALERARRPAAILPPVRYARGMR